MIGGTETDTEMKNETSLRSSRDAAIRKARLMAAFISDRLVDISENDIGDPRAAAIKRDMPNLRDAVAELNQRVHEMNAYNNALTTK